VAAHLLSVATLLLLLAGLLAPGLALARALRVSVTIATSFAGSAVALYVTVLALQLLNLPVAFGSILTGVMLIAVVAEIAARRRGFTNFNSNSVPGETGAQTLFGEFRGWTVLYALFWLAVLWRVWHQPLGGPDVEFRWGFLAEQMLRLGSLDFYPPRSAEDFFAYFWVESIPPGASVLHAWAYACSGKSAAGWTIPVTLLQLWSVHELAGRLAARLAGVGAARSAVLAMAGTPLLTWSILLGQETGLTALSLVGLAWALVVWRETRATGWAALAGVFALLGASAREYGLVFPALAGVGLLMYRADRRAWFWFLGPAAIVLVWPLRSAVLTGNPFYSLPAGPLPVNERFVAWIQHDADAFGAVLHGPAGWGQIARYLGLYAPVAFAGWIALVVGAVYRRRDAVLGFFAVFVVLALWVASVPYTNGGLFYSLRVTSPALALGAVAVGVSLTRVAFPARVRWLSRAFVGVFAAAALVATLALPVNAWRVPLRDWPAFAPSDLTLAPKVDESVDLVLKAMRSTSADMNQGYAPVVLTDGPGYQRRFRAAGVQVVPLWSPQADWLFEPSLSPTATFEGWRDSRIRYLILTKWGSNVAFFNERSRWPERPIQLQPLGETELTAVFAIRAVE
jgi:hypothetical protein